MAKILVVDDDNAIRRTLREILEFEKYIIEEATDGLECIVKIKKSKFDAIIMDIKMPKMDGMEALERVQTLAPETPIIMISGHASIDTAVDAVKKGAFDFVSKPPDLNRLLITIRNAMDKSTLIGDMKTIKKQVSKGKVQDIIGQSSSIVRLRETIDRIATTDARVLVLGENGTGKELVARWVHEKSSRRDNPLVEVNCAAISAELIESELFGHEKGSFTSAIKQHKGKFEQANGGTLFLDEIGDMSLQAQASVLRALEERAITRVGGDKKINVDVRVICATNKNLAVEMAEGRFREDLYHRIAVILMNVPPLNERREDIPLLVEHFVDMICSEHNIATKKITKEALVALQNVNWSGNIRELRNVVERLIILSGGEITDEDVLRFVVPSSNMNSIKLHGIFDKFSSVDEIHRFIDEEFTKHSQE